MGDKSSLKNHFYAYVSLFWFSLGLFGFFLSIFFNTPVDKLSLWTNSNILMRLFTINPLLLTRMTHNWSVWSRDCSLV